MKGTRFSEEQIIGVLREQEAGVKTDEVCRRHGISSATFYKWRPSTEGLRSPTRSGLRRWMMRIADSRSCWRRRCSTTQHSRTYSEKTSEACGAASSSYSGNGASRAE